VAFLFIGVLLHESHEEDEEDGGGGDADDDGEHHDGPADVGADRDIAVPHCDLRDHLVVEAGDEAVQLGVHLAKSKKVYL
jgi:hypothetical protein